MERVEERLRGRDRERRSKTGSERDVKTEREIRIARDMVIKI